MKPGDHPDFFRLAPPPGASRESTIVLDREGQLWHDGQKIEHAALVRAIRSWIRAHPEDGRPILTNGYDWCYFTAEGAPMFVDAVRAEGSGATIVLFDGSEEPLDPSLLWIGSDGVARYMARRGTLEARFTRHAQTGLGPLLSEDSDPPSLSLGGELHPLRIEA